MAREPLAEAVVRVAARFAVLAVVLVATWAVRPVVVAARLAVVAVARTDLRALVAVPFAPHRREDVSVRGAVRKNVGGAQDPQDRRALPARYEKAEADESLCVFAGESQVRDRNRDRGDFADSC